MCFLVYLLDMKIESSKSGELLRSTINCRVNPFRLKELMVCESGTDSHGRKDSLGKKIDRASFIFTRNRVGVIKVRCKINNRFYIGIFDVRDLNSEGFDTKIFERFDPILSKDFKEYGLGEFETQILAYFSDRLEAMNYRDFIANRGMDDGMEYYGADFIDEIIPRFVSIKLPHKMILKLFSHCSTKGSTLNSLLRSLILRYLKSL